MEALIRSKKMDTETLTTSFVDDVTMAEQS
jgi:hypothetical protein